MRLREVIKEKFTEKDKKTGALRQKLVTAESITMWFARHPDIKAGLEKEIVEEQLPAEAVDETIFENGTFESLPSVNNWIQEMEDRVLNPEVIRNMVGALKRACKGHLLPNPVFKHPDRLDLEQARQYLRDIKDSGVETQPYRIALRGFLLSKGIVVGQKISGAKGKGFGKYAQLYVESEICQDMINWIDGLNHEAAVCDDFMWKTGTRIDASLAARIEDVKTSDKGNRYITVYDKGRKSKYPEGHPWNKYISPDLWKQLQTVIKDRQTGKIFNITDQEMCKLNRAALKRFCPKIEHTLTMPNHFWRHMFFQHILRKTEWNISLAAALGGATTQSVEESYGQPPDYLIEEMGQKYMTQI